jgi:head-tail adaptor
MRHRLVYQEPVETADSTGQPAQSWADVFPLWGSVEPGDGREVLAGDQVRAVVSDMVQCREDVRLTAKGRLKYASRLGTTRYLNVLAVLPDDLARGRVIVLCAEDAAAATA